MTVSRELQEQIADMNKTSAELLLDLARTRTEPRSAHDEAIFKILVALAAEVADLRRQIG